MLEMAALMGDLPSIVAKARQARGIATMLADPARLASTIELLHAAVIDLLLAETDETVPPANLQMVAAALERLTRLSQTRNAVTAPDPAPAGGLSGQTIAEIKSRVLGLTLPS